MFGSFDSHFKHMVIFFIYNEYSYISTVNLEMFLGDAVSGMGTRVAEFSAVKLVEFLSVQQVCVLDIKKR